MEYSVDDAHVMHGVESFICWIDRTFAEQGVLNEYRKINCRTLKPMLFELPTYKYLAIGGLIGKCMSFRKKD